MSMDTRELTDDVIPDLRPWPLGRRKRSLPDPALPRLRLSGPVCSIIALSLGLTPLLYAAAIFLAGREIPDTAALRPCWSVAALVLARARAWLVWPGPISRWQRAACLVPLLHVGLMALCFALWRMVGQFGGNWLSRLPMVHDLDVVRTWLIAGALVLGLSLMPARRRTRGRVPNWLRFVVAFALARVVILGLWLPLAADGFDHLFAKAARHGRLADQVDIQTFLAVVRTPTTLLALFVAWLVTRHAELLARRRELIGMGVLFALAVALISRLDASFAAYLAYANMVPALLGYAAFALICVLALGVCHARVLFGARRAAREDAPWVQRGTVVVSDGGPDIVGWLEERGWLGGLVGRMRRFHISTAHGLLEVPASAHLIAPLPAPGRAADAAGAPLSPDHVATPMLRAGDAVVVSGYVTSVDDAAYRRSAAPVSGTQGMVAIRPREPGQTVIKDLFAIMWRPCALYLAAVLIAALPGAVALLL
jgi:hypothetical protein